MRARLPVVAQVGLDEGYADVTDAEKPLRVLRELVADVRDRTGITMSVGVGPNRLIAKVSSDLEKPQGFVAMGREEACRRLAGSSLRIIPGIGPKTFERLAAMGLTTIGALQRADAEALAARFGSRHARRAASRARTSTPPTSSRPSPGRPSRARTRRRSTATSPTWPSSSACSTRLAGQLCEGLQRKQARGRTIGIKVRLDDWTTVTRARTLPGAVNDTETVTGVALELLRAYDPPRPVRLLGVRVAAFEDGIAGEEPVRSPQLALPL